MDDKFIEKIIGEMKETEEMPFSQIINSFPYPIAIFTGEQRLVMVNRAFAEVTEMPVEDFEKEDVRILQYKIDDTRLASAFKKVFSGGTFFFEDIKDPFSMFSGIARLKKARSDPYKNAVIFPLPADDSCITHGVVVFMP